MTFTQVQKRGCFVFSNIQEGFDTYSYEIIKGTKEELYKLLEGEAKKNGKEEVYLDFYYGTLSEEEKQKVQQALNPKQAAYLTGRQWSIRKEEVYFIYEEELFEIAFLLSVTEVLFSTFYFPVLKKTYWSNYGGEFVAFSK